MNGASQSSCIITIILYAVLYLFILTLFCFLAVKQQKKRAAEQARYYNTIPHMPLIKGGFLEKFETPVAPVASVLRWASWWQMRDAW